MFSHSERQRLGKQLLQIYHVVPCDPPDLSSSQSSTESQRTSTTSRSRAQWDLCDQPFPSLHNMITLRRDDINGAVYHTAALVRQLAIYLGLQLPFTIKFGHGRVFLRPSSVFSGALSTSEHALYISRSTFNTLSTKFTTKPEVPKPVQPSTMSLLAMDSMMYVPPETNTSRAPTPPPRPRRFSGLRPIGDGPSFAALGAFPNAWMMLVYNIVYLAYTQGFKVHRLTAATNPLWLLFYSVQSPHFATYVAQLTQEITYLSVSNPAHTRCIFTTPAIHSLRYPA